MSDSIEVITPQLVVPGMPGGAHFDRSPTNHPLEAGKAHKTAREFGIPIGAVQERVWDCPSPIFVQEQSNCTMEAWARVLLTEPFRSMASPTQIALAESERDRLWAYNYERTIDGIPMPHDGSTLTAGAKACHMFDLEPKFGEVEARENGTWCYAHTADVNELRRYILNVGPVTAAVFWYKSMYDPDPTTGEVKVVGGPESRVDAHAICIRGYRPGRGYFWDNSWGPGYGLNGSAWFSEETMAHLLDEGGQVVAWYWKTN